MAKNARFWTWANGQHVKLTLKPGQRLSWGNGGPTDEGYAWRGFTVCLEDDVVTLEEETDGRDCDGRHGTYRVYTCHLDNLKGWINEDGFAMPTWKSGEGRDYDQYAEMAGY